MAEMTLLIVKLLGVPHDTSANAGFKQASELSASDYLYPDAKNLAPFLYRLRQDYPPTYQEIISSIQTVTPFFHDFYLEPRGSVGEEKILSEIPAKKK